MKNLSLFRYILILSTSLCCLVRPANAQTLTHRYLFQSNANDSVGSINFSYTTATATTESPLFGQASYPAGGLITSSMQVGMNTATSSVTSGIQSNAPSSLLDLTGNGAISLWFNFSTAQSTTGYLLGLLGGGTGNLMNLRFSGTDDLTFVCASSSSLTASNLSMGTWHNVVMSWDLTGTTPTALYYMDGALIGGVTVSGTLTLNSTLRLGNFNPGGGTGNAANQFVGSIADLQIYDSELSAAQVASLFSVAGSIVPEPDSLALAAAGLMFVVLRRRRLAL